MQPPPSKRAKIANDVDLEALMADSDSDDDGPSSVTLATASSSSSLDVNAVSTVIAQFQTREGEMTGQQISVPIDVSLPQLEALINDLLSNDKDDNDGDDTPRPYSFFLQDDEILTTLREIVDKQGASTETVLPIIYQPQAVFRVKSVARCTASLPGHSEAIISVQFGPNGKQIASGSGDCTVRIWDCPTETPKWTLKGHKTWVTAVAWSPLGDWIVSGDRNGEIRLWDPRTGKQRGRPFKGHTKTIASLAWEPMHRNPKCDRFVSASHDGTAKVFRVTSPSFQLSLTGHTKAVQCVRWGGEGFIYTASRDRMIGVFAADTGKLVRQLRGHGHWVNHLALSTDYAIRTGPFDHRGQRPGTDSEALEQCRSRYQEAKGSQGELMVSASDDFTMFLWNPIVAKKPVNRMTGHQQLVNHVCFSPDGRRIASASFDKSVRVWDGLTGKFIATMRGHVGAVYQVAWSADSRLLMSGSKDSTMKVWDLKTHKIKFDLPGHADEVYAVDWSPDGERVASGSKDKLLKIWRR